MDSIEQNKQSSTEPESFADFSEFLLPQFSPIDYIFNISREVKSFHDPSSKDLSLISLFDNLNRDVLNINSDPTFLPDDSKRKDSSNSNSHTNFDNSAQENSSYLQNAFSSHKTHIATLINKVESDYKNQLSENQLALLGQFTHINSLEEIVLGSKNYISEIKAQIQRVQWQMKIPLEQMETHLNSVTNLKNTLDIIRLLNKLVQSVRKLVEKFPDSLIPLEALKTECNKPEDNFKNPLFNSENMHLLLTFSASSIADINSLVSQTELNKIATAQNLIKKYVLPRQKELEYQANNMVKAGLDSQKILHVGVGLQVFFNLGLLNKKGIELINQILHETVASIENKIDYSILQDIVLGAKLSKEGSFMSNQSALENQSENKNIAVELYWDKLRDFINAISSSIQKINTIEKIFSSNKFVEKSSKLFQHGSDQVGIFDFISANAGFLNNKTIVGFWWSKVSSSLDSEIYKAKSHPILWSMFLTLYPRFAQLLDSAVRQVFGELSKEIVYDSFLLDARKDYTNQVRNRFEILSRKLLLFWKADELSSTTDSRYKYSSFMKLSNTGNQSYIDFMLLYIAVNNYEHYSDGLKIETNISKSIHQRSNLPTNSLDTKVLFSVLKGIQSELELVSLFEPLLLEIAEISERLICDIHNEVILRVCSQLEGKGNIFHTVQSNNSTNNLILKPFDMCQVICDHLNFLIDLYKGLVAIGWGSLSRLNSSKLRVGTFSNNSSKPFAIRTNSSAKQGVNNRKWDSTAFLLSLENAVENMMSSTSSVINTIFGNASSLIIYKLGELATAQAQPLLNSADAQINPGTESLGGKFETLVETIKEIFDILVSTVIKNSKSISVPPVVIFFICNLMKTFVSFGSLVLPSTEESNLQLVSFASNLEFECSQMLNSLSMVERDLLCCIQIDPSSNQILTNNNYNDLKSVLCSQGISGIDSPELSLSGFGSKDKIAFKLAQLGRPYTSIRAFRQMIFISNDALIEPTKALMQEIFGSDATGNEAIVMRAKQLVGEIENKLGFISNINKIDILNNLVSRIITCMYGALMDGKRFKANKEPPLSTTKPTNSQVANAEIFQHYSKILQLWFSPSLSFEISSSGSEIAKGYFPLDVRMFDLNNPSNFDRSVKKAEANKLLGKNDIDLALYVSCMVFSLESSSSLLQAKYENSIKERVEKMVSLLKTNLRKYFEFDTKNFGEVVCKKGFVKDAGVNVSELQRMKPYPGKQHGLDGDMLSTIGHLLILAVSFSEK